RRTAARTGRKAKADRGRPGAARGSPARLGGERMLRHASVGPSRGEKERASVSSQVATGTLAPAAIGQRAIAYLIDAIILSILYTLLVSFAAVASLLRGDTGLTDSLLRAVLFAVASFVYFAYTWRAMRASPGQRVLGLTTVNAADGAPLSSNQASLQRAY